MLCAVSGAAPARAMSQKSFTSLGFSISVGIELSVATAWSEAAEAMKKAGGRAYKGPKK